MRGVGASLDPDNHQRDALELLPSIKYSMLSLLVHRLCHTVGVEEDRAPAHASFSRTPIAMPVSRGLRLLPIPGREVHRGIVTGVCADECSLLLVEDTIEESDDLGRCIGGDECMCPAPRPAA